MVKFTTISATVEYVFSQNHPRQQTLWQAMRNHEASGRKTGTDFFQLNNQDRLLITNYILKSPFILPRNSLLFKAVSNSAKPDSIDQGNT